MLRCSVRITFDLPDYLHDLTKRIARDENAPLDANASIAAVASSHVHHAAQETPLDP
jgi:hypothetical protein